MQLSVLILESSFYSFFFFLSLPLLLCNLFFYSVSAVIRTVAADDKKYIRLPDFSPPPFTPLRRLKSCSRLFQRLCCGFGRRRCLRRRAKSFPGEFSFWRKFFTKGFLLLLLLMLHPNTWKKERPTLLRLKGL